MKKTIVYFLLITAALSALVTGINIHDRNVYMAGYNAHKNEVHEFNLATLKSSQQKTALQAIEDTRRQQQQLAEQDARRDYFEQLKTEAQANEKTNGDYPAVCRLNDGDFKLLQRAAMPRTDNISQRLGADTRGRAAHTVAGCSDAERADTERPSRLDHRTLKAVLRQPGASHWPYQRGAITASL